MDGNIVIQTKEKYKNNGYGKTIVERISRDMENDQIIPIYWVDVKNKASFELARSLLFEIMAEEIVVKVNEN